MRNFLFTLLVALVFSLLSTAVMKHEYKVPSFFRFEDCLVMYADNTDTCYTETTASGFPFGFAVDYTFVGSGDEFIPTGILEFILEPLFIAFDYKYLLYNIVFYIILLYGIDRFVLKKRLKK